MVQAAARALACRLGMDIARPARIRQNAFLRRRPGMLAASLPCRI